MKILQWAIALFLVLTSNVTIAGMPIAGYELENQSTANYFSTSANKNIEVLSNTVKTIIMPVPQMLLSPKSINKNVSKSENVFFIHELKNTGNTTIYPILSWGNLLDDDYDLLDVEVYLDTNKDGVIDFSDIKLSSNHNLELNYEETKQIILKGFVPASINNMNTRAKLELKAELLLEGFVERAEDTAMFLDGPFMEIEAFATPTIMNRGDQTQITFNSQNIGTYKANPTEIYIDGVLTERVYVKSNIPLNSTFKGFNEPSPMNSNIIEQLYHLAGESKYSFHSGEVSEENRDLVDFVTFTYNKIEIGEVVSSGYYVSANDNANNSLKYKFDVYYKDGLSIQSKDSNEVEIIIVDPFGGELNFINNDLSQYIITTNKTNPIALELNAGGCNQDASIIDIINVTLSTDNLNDEEVNFTLEETSVNSGLFYLQNIPVNEPLSGSAQLNNNIMEVTNNDKIYASVACGNEVFSDNLYINPVSTLVNSDTNEPVANMKVKISKVGLISSSLVSKVKSASSISKVRSLSVSAEVDLNITPDFNDDVLEIDTNSSGQFILPVLSAGSYKLDVNVDETSYVFPSDKELVDLVVENRSYKEGISFGEVFTITEDDTVLVVDIPVDNKSLPGLFVTKEISTKEVEIGEIITYNIEIFNKTGSNLVNIKLDDWLPLGVSILNDEILIEDVVTDFTRENNKIEIEIGEVSVNEKIEITYKASVSALAKEGNKKNVAQARTGNILSNKATVSFIIKDKVFDSSGLLIGKVFMDCNNNRIQEREELGIPNVKLYLDTGHYVETDSEGKYHFNNLSSRTYSLVVDQSTLPRGHIFHKTKSRNNNDPYSMFIDIKDGDLFKANFAEGMCDQSFTKLVNLRRDKLLGLKGKHGDRKYDDSSKKKNYLEMNEYSDPTKESDENDIFESNVDINSIDDFILTETTVDINEVVKDLDNKLGFINLKEKDVLPLSQMSIQIKGKVGSKFKLKLNGEPISNSRVGQKYVVKTKQLEIWEYIAIKFESGKNTLEVQQVDPFGNVRGKEKINIVVPGERAKINIIIPKEKQVANGYSETKIKIRVTDKEGNKITSKTPITLESTYAKWDVKDLNDSIYGIQTFVKRGEETFKLISPVNIQEDVIVVESGVIKAQANVKFKPNLKKLMVTGIVSMQSGDKITQWDKADDDHVSLFMQGRIKGDWLLTLNYDNKFEKELHSKIKPDQFYEIYGDTSKLGFEGETHKKLYVKIEKENIYALYGTFTPRFTNNEMKVINYQKTMPGVDAGINITDNLKVRAFIGIDGEKTIKKEVDAKGISGPYDILPEITENLHWTLYITEKDEFGNIIERVEQVLYQDYIVDDFSGHVYFNRAITQGSSDSKFYIEAEYYEIDGSNPYYTKGITSEYIKNNTWVNASYIEEDNTGNKLYGVAFKKKINNSQIEVEYGVSTDENNDMGEASKVKYKMDSLNHKFKVEFNITDPDYKNQYATVKSGNQNLKIESYHVINKDWKFKNQADYQKDDNVETEVLSYYGRFHKTISKNINAEFGYKMINRELADQSDQDLDILSNSIVYNPDWLAKSQWTLLSDVDVNSGDKMIEVGSEYYLQDRSKIYFKHKLINDLDSSFGVNNRNLKTSIGFNYEHNKEGNMYSELRLRDQEDGEALTTVFGFNQGIKISKNTKFNFGYERGDSWETEDDTQSAYLGFEHKTETNDIYNSQLEYATTKNENIYGFNFSLINKIDKNVSLFNKLKYEYIENKIGDPYNRLKVETNYIYRPVDNDRLNWMFGYEYVSDNQYELDETHYMKTYLNYQVTTNLEYLAHVGHKSKPLWDYSGTWITNRLMYELTEKIDIGVRASTLMDTSSQNLFGIEMGYQLAGNIWVTGGYNFKEIQDKYYNDNKADIAQGYYAKLRIKLDESLFFWLQ
jgi:uncharacterized repeat protein (TIGR01451 family)